MTGLVRARYTLEFKQEAVRLVRGGQTVSSVAKTLGLSDQTLHNWLKAEAAGGLREITGKVVSAERMEIARLKAELAKTRMERDILKNRRGTRPCCSDAGESGFKGNSAQKASDFHVGSGSCLSSFIRKADGTFPASVIGSRTGANMMHPCVIAGA